MNRLFSHSCCLLWSRYIGELLGIVGSDIVFGVVSRHCSEMLAALRTISPREDYEDVLKKQDRSFLSWHRLGVNTF